MYEKLISSLRICQGMCEGSRFEEAAKLLTQAADAIEELSAVVESYRHRMAYVPQPPKGGMSMSFLLMFCGNLVCFLLGCLYSDWRREK